MQNCITAGKSLDELKQELARNTAMPDHVHFEVGDAVKVTYHGVDMYGTLKWQGNLPEGGDMAGIEMVSVQYTIYTTVSGSRSIAVQVNVVLC